MKKIMLFLLLLLPFIILSQIPEQPSIGDGSAGSPYEISTLGHLAWLSDPANSGEWDKHYIQTANIVADATVGWNGGLGFNPIGSTSPYPYFSGSYDGNYYTISGLTINRPTFVSIGFIYFNTGDLSRISLVNVNIVGQSYVGSVFGQNSSSVSECYSSGTVNGQDLTGGIGGLCNPGSVISKCKSSCDVVSTTGWGGALVSYSFGSITDSYSTGSISGSTAIGGLCGYNHGGQIVNCYSSSIVNGGININAGLTLFSSGTCTSSYWDITTSGQTGSACGSPLTTTQMGDPSNFVGWDFTNTWVMSGAKAGYPQLQWEANIGGGTATPLNPYLLWVVPLLIVGFFCIRRSILWQQC